MLQLFSPSFSRPCASGQRVAVCLVLAILATFAINPQLANAQKGAKVTTVTGKLVSVKKKGRTATLTVKTSDGETKDFQIAARTKLTVTAKGDDGFLKKGQFVSTQAVESNNMLFAKKFTVQVGAGRKAGVFAKPPKSPGVSKSAWNVAGLIMGRANDAKYPEYEVISVRTGKRTVPVFLDKGYSVTVLLGDVSVAGPGSKVTIEGKPGKRDRFTVTAAKVELAKPLKAEEFFVDKKKPKKRRSVKGE